MNPRLQGSSSGAELNDARDAHDAPRLVSGRLEEKEGFSGLVMGQDEEPEKTQVVDAGLKSMDHCMRLPTSPAPSSFGSLLRPSHKKRLVVFGFRRGFAPTAMTFLLLSTLC